MVSKKAEINRLFSTSKNISDKKFSKDLLSGLPEPVKRYFSYVLTEGQSFVSYARLKHGGLFRQKEKWMTIKGEEYFTAEKPGFFWKASVPLMSAKDLYIEGEGNLVIKLLSLFKVVDEKGPEVNQGELLRWLGEAPLFPTVLLPSENLHWEAIDDNSAKVILSNNELTVEGVFCFNEKGEVASFKAKRFMDKTLEDWTGYYNDFREVNGMKIPFYLEVVWTLETGDYSYAKFSINEIEFDNPKSY